MVGVITSGVIALVAYINVQESVEKYTVTFAYQDGTVIEKKEVRKGEGVYPPEFPNEGVFRGWSNAFNAVQDDVEVHPLLHNITEDNLFYFDALYVKEGTEFALDIYVGGNVSVSSGVLTLEYDSNVLDYKESDNIDSCTVTEIQSGKLEVKLENETSILEKTLLSKLSFFAKKVDAYSTELWLTAKDVKTVASGKVISADYATINNKVYFLQEVRQ